MSCWFLLVFQACALLDVDPARRADPITVRQFGKVDVALTRWILYLDKNDAHSQLMAMVSSRRNDVASIVLALNDYYQLWSNIRSWSAGSAGLVGLTATEVGIKSMEAAVSRMKDTLRSTLVSPRETAALVALFLADAQSRLGRYEESLVSYRTATELGSSVARMFIGHCYHLGRGVPANATLAELWYRSAADSFMRGDATQDAPGQSPAFATRSLARAYMKGLDVYKPIGLPQPSYDQAARWFGTALDGLQASSEGLAAAYLGLAASLYNRGDHTVAVEYLVKAAGLNNTVAMVLAGMMFFHGRGTARNELTAQMYINQALTAHPPCTSAEEALRTTCRRGCLEGGCWLLADEETFEYFFRFTFI